MTTRSMGTPCARTASRAPRMSVNSPSTAARATCAGSQFASVMPSNVAVASGRFGVRSPSKYGISRSPPASGTDRAASSNSSYPRPVTRLNASIIRDAFSVHASGSHRPDASEKPVTRPDGSDTADSDTAATTPDVPRLSIAAPGPKSTPRAAAALSPAPGPKAISPQPRASSPCATTSYGSAIRGSTMLSACSSLQCSAWARMSRRYADPDRSTYPVPEASDRSVANPSNPRRSKPPAIRHVK